MKYTVAVLVVLVSLYSYYFWYYQDTDLTLLFYEKFGREPCSVLSGKVVWITGASSGIGEYLAYELARCGCKLILSARRKEELERVRDNCTDKYPSFNKEDVLVLPLDLGKFSTHTELANHVIQRFGKIEVLVNNAGVGQVFTVEKGDFEVDKSVLDLNLLGTISLTKAVLPHMLKRQQGQIVVVSSIAGKYQLYGYASYCASKFALQGYFGTLRLETLERGIKVLTVQSGPVQTAIFRNVFTGKPNVTLKDMPYYKPGMEKNRKVNFMSPKRHGYLMTVAMANNLKEIWPTTQPALATTYLSQYMPSFFMWLQEKSKVMRAETKWKTRLDSRA